MPKYIAILRGINVGGKRKIVMADLMILFQEIGYTNIHTYIQSGNVIFDADGNEGQKSISEKIEKQILKTFGFVVLVIVRTGDEIKQAISINPFLKEGVEIERLYLTFLKEVPAAGNLETIKSFDLSPDKFEIIGKNVFCFYSGKYSESKITNQFFEKKLKVSATTRNWKTVNKLQQIVFGK